LNLAVFDIDGTLTDSFGFDAHYYAALSQRLGVVDPQRTLESWTHVTDEAIVGEFFELHGCRASREDIDWVKAEYQTALERNLHRVPQIPGASEFLLHLRGLPDWHVIVGTRNWGFAGEMKLDAGGIERAGITVVGCDERPERTAVVEHALRLALEQTDAVERVVYIGDRHYDVTAARALGWNFVGRSDDRGALTRLGATHVLADFLDVDGALAALHACGAPTA
jgi:phosphoglycolate phosphatase-like HAD superfamily hydrolase